jgi:hypothetical protein
MGVAGFGHPVVFASTAPNAKVLGGLPGVPHFAPKAKRAIYLHMVGAPPQMDLFDYKPQMMNCTTKICRSRSVRVNGWRR